MCRANKNILYFTCNNAAAQPISVVFVAVAVVNVTCQCLGSGGPAPQYQVSTTGEAPPNSARMALQPPSESSPTLQGQLVPTMCGRLVCSYSLITPGQSHAHMFVVDQHMPANSSHVPPEQLHRGTNPRLLMSVQGSCTRAQSSM